MLLPLPLTPVTATRQPSGKLDVDVLEVVLARAAHGDPVLAGLAPHLGDRDAPLAGEVLPGDRVLLLEQVLQRARDDDLAAVLAGARTDVDDVVGDADRLLVVLDDDHRVAEVAQAQHRVDEALVVALVQPDRRLVEHVEHAGEAAADLRREPDALRLAAGERARRAVEAEVVEADVEEEPEPLVDLLEDPLGDHPVALRQLELEEELARLADREVPDLGDVLAVDRDRERLGPEAVAVARGARHLAHVPLDLLARAVALRLGVAALQPRDHTLVAGVVGALAAVAVLVLHEDLLGSPAVQDDLLRRLLELLPRRRRGEAVLLGHRASSTRLKYSPRKPDHGAIAPSSIERSSSETTSSGSTSKRVPSPSQRSHAP